MPRPAPHPAAHLTKNVAPVEWSMKNIIRKKLINLIDSVVEKHANRLSREIHVNKVSIESRMRVIEKHLDYLCRTIKVDNPPPSKTAPELITADDVLVTISKENSEFEPEVIKILGNGKLQQSVLIDKIVRSKRFNLSESKTRERLIEMTDEGLLSRQKTMVRGKKAVFYSVAKGAVQ